MKILGEKPTKCFVVIICIVCILAAAFFLQPMPNSSIQASNDESSSSAQGIDGSFAPGNMQSEGEDYSFFYEIDSKSSDENSHLSTDNISSENQSNEGADIGGSILDNSDDVSSFDEMSHDEMSHDEMSHDEMSHDEMSHDDMSQGNGSSEPDMGILPDTERDMYETDPIPEGKPAPVEPQNTVIDESKRYTCTLSIRCDTILNNMSLLKEEKKAVVASDGIILEETTVAFSEGESVFDLLKRITREKRIHMEFEMTPIYNSAYIEGINNLYEFDCGSLSGWMYSVNDWFPNYGCSRYQLQQGDRVEWVYTCDLGRDIGDSFLAGQGKS